MRKKTTKKKRRARRLVDDVSAVLLISPDAKRLCEFYKKTLGIPLEVERHDDIALHYGYTFGDVHFAIHSADGGWPGGPSGNSRSPVISFGTSNLKAVVRRLSANGTEFKGPTDHGFGHIVSFRDPDGNLITLIEYAPEHW
jgi:catechol 2,3-dioxygenase-like lactoylglutathione lyase family enzyme